MRLLSEIFWMVLFVMVAIVIASGTVMARPASGNNCSSCHGTVQFSQNPYTLTQGLGVNAVITITRTGGTASAIAATALSVRFDTMNGHLVVGSGLLGRHKFSSYVSQREHGESDGKRTNP